MYKRQLKTIKPYFLKEASFLSGSLQKVIINMVKILQKRLGQRLLGDVDTVFTVRKSSGYYSGVKFYVGKNGTAIRFNWLMGKNNTLHSVDVFHKYRTQPLHTLEVMDLNINQVLEAIVEHLSTGQTQIAVNEYDNKGYPVLNEIGLGGIKALFTKAEKEIPQVETETEQVVKKVKIKALTGTQIFEQIERYTESILDPNSGNNLLIIAGQAGVGKTQTSKEVLQKISGSNISPPLRVLPSPGSKAMKDYMARTNDASGKELPSSLQKRLREISDQIKPFESKWVLGSQDVKGLELFVEMFQSNGNVLVYDDADTVFTIKENKLLLKQAMDTKGVRTIKWGAKVPYVDLGKNVGIIPREFQYTGKMIIISNLSSGQIDPALKSRALFVNVELTPLQFMDRLKSLMPIIQKNEAPNIPLQTFEQVFDWLYNMFVIKKVIDRFDIRTFNSLVKEMQILKGDLGLWESIAAMAIMQKYPGANFIISEE